MRTRVFTSPAWLVPALLFFVLGCNLHEDSTSRSLSEQPSACTLIDATMPVYGPVEFSRDTGKPKTEYATFETPLKGEVCVVVVNGLHDPPHGKRISSAWIRIDGKLAIDPDAFSQEVDEVTEPFPVTAGEHELSVKLASRPGAFITVELSFLPADTEPPEISIVPRDGARVSTDMPLLWIGYTDDISGVDLESLSILMNGSDVAESFQVDEAEAEWQLTIDSYLEEGPNELNVSLSDRIGNTAVVGSSFQVHTPTEVLIEDLDRPDPRYRRRSAYKLLFRQEALTIGLLHRCLNQLNETPEPKAVDRLMEMLFLAWVDHHSRVLATGALGEAARVDADTAARDDLVDLLGGLLLGDESFVVKAVAARALGLTMNANALGYLEEYIENDGPENPPVPASELLEQYLQYDGLKDAVALQAVRAIIRIAGHAYQVGNPGDLEHLRKKYVGSIENILRIGSQLGGAP